MLGGSAVSDDVGSLEDLWKRDRKEFLEYWHRCEQVAVHFNDLNAKFRLQALAGLAVAGAVLGAVLKADENSGDWALAGALWGLLAAWCAVAWIDGWYYGKLLRGAVVEIVRIEKATAGVLNMSSAIENACKTGRGWRTSRIGRVGFYVFPGLALVVASVLVVAL